MGYMIYRTMPRYNDIDLHVYHEACQIKFPIVKNYSEMSRQQIRDFSHLNHYLPIVSKFAKRRRDASTY